MQSDLAELSALEARDRIVRGEVTAVAMTEAVLARIAEKEPAVGTFAFLDPDLARRRATILDDQRRRGEAAGPLHGLALGVKDIIDTDDMPTENGTRLDAGRRPAADATIVARLRKAGAVIIGKTVTTELAFFHPGKTRNPMNLAYTPGGSSSGSAAAVAAGMIPLAVGTQTNGSVIRPASFCGVVGYKPTRGLIPRTGVLHHNPMLDTIGVFARNVADAALLAEAIAGPDPFDADTGRAAPPGLLAATLAELPRAPRFAFLKTPFWERAEPETRSGISRIAGELQNLCREEPLPDLFADAPAAQRVLMLTGFARNLRIYRDRDTTMLSDIMRNAIDEGMRISAMDYLAALELRDGLNRTLHELFDRYDAILTPAAPGEAPHGLELTGNPIFNGLWTLCGVPAITLPLLKGPNGLPIGVQLIGRHGEDARLLRTARWLMDAVPAT